MQHLQQNPSANYIELAAKTGNSSATIKRHIQELKKQGIIERIGSDKTGFWRLKKSLSLNTNIFSNHDIILFDCKRKNYKLMNRFHDENLLLSEFYKEVWVACPSCAKKAMATVNFENQIARLFCLHCGYNKETSTAVNSVSIETAANHYFQAELWLQAPFKNEVFWVYNHKHLVYLERYISATIREHKDRSGFTLLEKLPKFYHEAKNREGLLKIIAKLKTK